MDAPAAPLARCDIAALLAASNGGGGRAGAAHSVAAAALHRTPAGWGVTLLGAPLRGDGWGASLPGHRALLAALPGFPAGRLTSGAPLVQARAPLAVRRALAAPRTGRPHPGSAPPALAKAGTTYVPSPLCLPVRPALSALAGC